MERSDRRFRALFEDSRAGVALVDAGSDLVVEANGALCELTGHARDELVGLALSSLLEEEGPGGGGRVHHADGHWLPADVTFSLVNETGGGPAQRIVQVEDVSERRRFKGQLQYLTDHDLLTGLFNRRRFEEELERELGLAGRYGTDGAVLALGLDGFRYVNDSLGHSAGDELVASVAHALRKRLRSSDTVARIGGDEFALLLPRVTEEEALAVADNLRAAVREQAVGGGDQGLLRVGASVGVASYAGRARKLTSEMVLIEAELAMYDAKAAGRDRAVVHDPATDAPQRMQAQVAWVERIRCALEEDGLMLQAQPILPLGTEGVSRSELRMPRHELLVRMVGDDGELVPPRAFLPLAEQVDLIQEIDRWVLERAIELLAKHQGAGRQLCLEVNLSAKSVNSSMVYDTIRSALDRTGADPRGLVLEVTETAAIVNLERAKRLAEQLRSLGCRFALDDFGAGFASFYYLKHFAFDYLKIDGEFIRDLASNDTNRLVVRALVDIARGLDKKTIAECVEDDATRHLLELYGVDYVQGHLIGPPAALEHIATGRRGAAARVLRKR